MDKEKIIPVINSYPEKSKLYLIRGLNQQKTLRWVFDD